MRENNCRTICEEQFLSAEGIREVFDKIDTSHDGSLTIEEVQEALKVLNLHITDDGIAKLFEELQASPGEEKNHISFKQFTSFVRIRENLLAEVFCELDINGNGTLDVPEVLAALKKLKIQATKNEVEKLISNLDKDGDGVVDFKEFCALTLLCPNVNVESVFNAWKQSADASGDFSYIPTTTKIHKSDPWKILFAGGVAGAISRSVTAPFDRLKILLQVGGSAAGVKVDGILSGLKAIYKEGGMKGFFRGNGTNCVKIAPESGIKFLAYERLKKVIFSSDSGTGAERFAAGALAGVVAQTCIYPLEVTKTRLAVAPAGTYKGIVDCIIKTAKKESPKGLFRGLGTSLIGIVPYAGVDLSVFFTLKEAYMIKNNGESPGVVPLLLMGGTSSFCGQVTAYPLNLVRTRLQSQGISGSVQQYNGMIDCFVKVYREGGFLGFYRGILPNFMKAIPAISISYVIYEKVKILIGA